MSRFVLTAQMMVQAPKNLGNVSKQIRSQLANINAPVNVQVNAQSQKALANVNAATKDVAKNAELASSSMYQFGKSVGLAAKRFAAYAIATSVMFKITGAMAEATQAAVKFERELIKVGQVTGSSMNALKGLTDEISRLATGLGVSSQSLVEVSRVLAQAGLSAKDTKIALAALAKTELAPTFENIADTAETAIAVLNQFGMGVGKLEAQLGSINKVAGSFAVEASDLSVVIRRAGGAFKAAGGDLEELIALFTAVRQTTRESAETIATGFRTIFTRMRRPSTIKFLEQIGVSLNDLEGNFVGPFQAVEKLNKALAGLDPRNVKYAAIIEELGGFRQVSKVIPLIQQFAVAQRAYSTAQEGANSLTADAQKAQQSLAVQFQKVREEFDALVRKIADSSSFRMMADMAMKMAKSLIRLGEAVAPLLPLLTTMVTMRVGKGIFGMLSGEKGGGIGAAIQGFMDARKTGAGEYNKGGRVLKFARGGVVPGSGNRDTVPAMLQPGEFVIRKSSVDKLGAGNLEKMNRKPQRRNRGGRIQRFNGGGPVVGSAEDPQIAMFTGQVGKSEKYSENLSNKSYLWSTYSGLTGNYNDDKIQKTIEDKKGKPGALHVDIMRLKRNEEIAADNVNNVSGFIDEQARGMIQKIGKSISGNTYTISKDSADAALEKSLDISKTRGNILEGAVGALLSEHVSQNIGKSDAKFDFTGHQAWPESLMTTLYGQTTNAAYGDVKMAESGIKGNAGMGAIKKNYKSWLDSIQGGSSHPINQMVTLPEEAKAVIDALKMPEDDEAYYKKEDGKYFARAKELKSGGDKQYFGEAIPAQLVPDEVKNKKNLGGEIQQQLNFSEAKKGGHYAVSGDTQGISSFEQIKKELLRPLLANNPNNIKVNFVAGASGAGKSTYTAKLGAEPLRNIQDAFNASELTVEFGGAKTSNMDELAELTNKTGGQGIYLNPPEDVVAAQRQKRMDAKEAGTHSDFDKRSMKVLKVAATYAPKSNPELLERLKEMVPNLQVFKKGGSVSPAMDFYDMMALSGREFAKPPTTSLAEPGQDVNSLVSAKVIFTKLLKKHGLDADKHLGGLKLDMEADSSNKGQYDYAENAIKLNPKHANEAIMKHELGHAIDRWIQEKQTGPAITGELGRTKGLYSSYDQDSDAYRIASEQLKKEKATPGHVMEGSTQFRPDTTATWDTKSGVKVQIGGMNTRQEKYYGQSEELFARAMEEGGQNMADMAAILTKLNMGGRVTDDQIASLVTADTPAQYIKDFIAEYEAIQRAAMKDAEENKKERSFASGAKKALRFEAFDQEGYATDAGGEYDNFLVGAMDGAVDSVMESAGAGFGLGAIGGLAKGAVGAVHDLAGGILNFASLGLYQRAQRGISEAIFGREDVLPKDLKDVPATPTMEMLEELKKEGRDPFTKSAEAIKYDSDAKKAAEYRKQFGRHRLTDDVQGHATNVLERGGAGFSPQSRRMADASVQLGIAGMGAEDVEYFNKGGSAGPDTVPALLTPGEYVLNKKSAESIGYTKLDRMNKVGKFNKGGPVGTVQRFQGGGTVDQVSEMLGEGGLGLGAKLGMAATSAGAFLQTMEGVSEETVSFGKAVTSAGVSAAAVGRTFTPHIKAFADKALAAAQEADGLRASLPGMVEELQAIGEVGLQLEAELTEAQAAYEAANGAIKIYGEDLTRATVAQAEARQAVLENQEAHEKTTALIAEYANAHSQAQALVDAAAQAQDEQRKAVNRANNEYMTQVRAMAPFTNALSDAENELSNLEADKITAQFKGQDTSAIDAAIKAKKQEIHWAQVAVDVNRGKMDDAKRERDAQQALFDSLKNTTDGLQANADAIQAQKDGYIGMAQSLKDSRKKLDENSNAATKEVTAIQDLINGKRQERDESKALIDEKQKEVDATMALGNEKYAELEATSNLIAEKEKEANSSAKAAKRMEMLKKAGQSAVAAATFLGSMLGDAADKAVAAGEEQVKFFGVTLPTDVAAGISGGVTGAINGAGIGAEIGGMFGPWGAAIGGAIGGIVGAINGYMNAAREARDGLRQVKLDKQVEEIGTGLEKALKDIPGASKAQQLAANKAAVASQAEAVAKARSIAVSMEDADKRAEALKQVNEQVNAQKALIDKMVQNADSYTDIEDAMGPMLDQMALAGESTLAYTKSIYEQLEVRRRAKQAQESYNKVLEDQKKRMDKLTKLSLGLTRLQQSTAAATVALENFASFAEGGIGRTKIGDQTSALKDVSSFAGTAILDAQIQQVASLLGAGGASIANEANAMATAMAALPDILSAAASEVKKDPATKSLRGEIISQITDQLGSEIGGTPVGEMIIKKITAVLPNEADADKLMEEIMANPKAAAEKLGSDFTQIFEEFAKAGQLVQQNMQQLADGLASITKIELSIAQERAAMLDTEIAFSQKLLQIRGREPKIGLARINSLNKQNKMLEGADKALAGNSKKLGDQIRFLQEKIAQRSAGLQGIGDVEARQKEIAEIEKLRKRLGGLQAALKFAADKAQEKGIVESQLAKATNDRMTKMKTLEEFAFSDTAGREQMVGQARAANTLAVTGDISAIPEAMRGAAKSFLDRFENVRLAQFGNRTGAEVKQAVTAQELAKSLGRPLTAEEFESIFKETDKEAELISELERISKEELAAQEQLLKSQEHAVRNMETAIADQNQKFLDELKKILKPDEKAMADLSAAAMFNEGGKAQEVSSKKNKASVFKPKGTDTVPAMLSPGEFVVNSKDAKANYDLLVAINSGAKVTPQYLNKGTESKPVFDPQHFANDPKLIELYAADPRDELAIEARKKEIRNQHANIGDAANLNQKDEKFSGKIADVFKHNPAVQKPDEFLGEFLKGREVYAQKAGLYSGMQSLHVADPSRISSAKTMKGKGPYPFLRHMQTGFVDGRKLVEPFVKKVVPFLDDVNQFEQKARAGMRSYIGFKMGHSREVVANEYDDTTDVKASYNRDTGNPASAGAVSMLKNIDAANRAKEWEDYLDSQGLSAEADRYANHMAEFALSPFVLGAANGDMSFLEDPELLASLGPMAHTHNEYMRAIMSQLDEGQKQTLAKKNGWNNYLNAIQTYNSGKFNAVEFKEVAGALVDNMLLAAWPPATIHSMFNAMAILHDIQNPDAIDEGMAGLSELGAIASRAMAVKDMVGFEKTFENAIGKVNKAPGKYNPKNIADSLDFTAGMSTHAAEKFASMAQGPAHWLAVDGMPALQALLNESVMGEDGAESRIVSEKARGFGLQFSGFLTGQIKKMQDQEQNRAVLDPAKGFHAGMVDFIRKDMDKNVGNDRFNPFVGGDPTTKDMFTRATQGASPLKGVDSAGNIPSILESAYGQVGVAAALYNQILGEGGGGLLGQEIQKYYEDYAARNPDASQEGLAKMKEQLDQVKADGAKFLDKMSIGKGSVETVRKVQSKLEQGSSPFYEFGADGTKVFEEELKRWSDVVAGKLKDTGKADAEKYVQEYLNSIGGVNAYASSQIDSVGGVQSLYDAFNVKALVKEIDPKTGQAKLVPKKDAQGMEIGAFNLAQGQAEAKKAGQDEADAQALAQRQEAAVDMARGNVKFMSDWEAVRKYIESSPMLIDYPVGRTTPRKLFHQSPGDWELTMFPELHALYGSITEAAKQGFIASADEQGFAYNLDFMKDWYSNKLPDDGGIIGSLQGIMTSAIALNSGGAAGWRFHKAVFGESIAKHIGDINTQTSTAIQELANVEKEWQKKPGNELAEGQGVGGLRDKFDEQIAQAADLSNMLVYEWAGYSKGGWSRLPAQMKKQLSFQFKQAKLKGRLDAQQKAEEEERNKEGGREDRFAFATGGIVSGRGGVDNVPAMLTAGEYVIKKSAVNKYGAGFFEALNGAGQVSLQGGVGHYANGGMVQDFTPMLNEFLAAWTSANQSLISEISAAMNNNASGSGNGGASPEIASLSAALNNVVSPFNDLTAAMNKFTSGEAVIHIEMPTGIQVDITAPDILTQLGGHIQEMIMQKVVFAINNNIEHGSNGGHKYKG